MPQVTYIAFNGGTRTVDVKPGLTVMEGAVKNAVPGIDAECGGNCACGTCHVFVDPAWIAKVGGRTSIEESMLSFAQDAEPASRLACQIKLTDDLDGLVVRTPERQQRI
jgi:2Fe-2S ferredoxin